MLVKNASQYCQMPTATVREGLLLGFTNNGTSFDQQFDSFHIILRNGKHQWSDGISSFRIGDGAIGIHATFLQQRLDQWCSSSSFTSFMEESPSCFRIHLVSGSFVFQQKPRHLDFILIFCYRLPIFHLIILNDPMKNRMLTKRRSAEICSTFQQRLDQWEIDILHGLHQWGLSIEIGNVDERMGVDVVIPVVGVEGVWMRFPPFMDQVAEEVNFICCLTCFCSPVM